MSKATAIRPTWGSSEMPIDPLTVRVHVRTRRITRRCLVAQYAIGRHRTWMAVLAFFGRIWTVQVNYEAAG